MQTSPFSVPWCALWTTPQKLLKFKWIFTSSIIVNKVKTKFAKLFLQTVTSTSLSMHLWSPFLHLRHSRARNQSHQDGSVDEDTYFQASWSEFDSQNPHGGRKQPTLAGYPLSSKNTQWHGYPLWICKKQTNKQTNVRRGKEEPGSKVYKRWTLYNTFNVSIKVCSRENYQ